MITPHVNILFLEDNPDDAFFLTRVCNTIPGCYVYVCRNAGEAKAYLMGAGMYADRLKFPVADAVVTDLCIGEETGHKFIEWIKHGDFKRLPVFVLTSAVTEVDRARLLDIGVQEVLEKPGLPERLKEILLHVISRLAFGKAR